MLPCCEEAHLPERGDEERKEDVEGDGWVAFTDIITLDVRFKTYLVVLRSAYFSLLRGCVRLALVLGAEFTQLRRDKCALLSKSYQ